MSNDVELWAFCDCDAKTTIHKQDKRIAELEQEIERLKAEQAQIKHDAVVEAIEPVTDCIIDINWGWDGSCAAEQIVEEFMKDYAAQQLKGEDDEH